MSEKEKAPSRLIDERIKELGDWRGKTLSQLRTLIKQADPEVVEEWKWRGVPVWSHDGIICTGETYKNVVKMTFAKGAALEDPSGLFNSSLEGNVRRAIDIHEGEKIDARGAEGAGSRGRGAERFQYQSEEGQEKATGLTSRAAQGEYPLDSLLATAAALVLTLCGFTAGRYLGRHLPKEHLKSETTDFVKIVAALITTMAAILLGLQLSSAKNSFDSQQAEVTGIAADVIIFDTTLSHSGAGSQRAREIFHRLVAADDRSVRGRTNGIPRDLRRPQGRANYTIAYRRSFLVPKSSVSRRITLSRLL